MYLGEFSLKDHFKPFVKPFLWTSKIIKNPPSLSSGCPWLLEYSTASVGCANSFCPTRPALVFGRWIWEVNRPVSGGLKTYWKKFDCLPGIKKSTWTLIF